MEGSKLPIDFAVAFLMLMAVSATAVQPRGGGYRIIQTEELTTVRGGGGGLPSDGKYGSSSGGSSASAVNIPLKNVPYITQYLNPYDIRNTSTEVSRSGNDSVLKLEIDTTGTRQNGSQIIVISDGVSTSTTIPMYTTAFHRLVKTSELKTIKGGISLPTSTPSIGGKGGSYGSSDSVNITLNNVPYVNQHITNNQRSIYYCGLASALMVRGKDSFGYSAPTVPNVAANMQKMDNYLLGNNRYGHRLNGWSGYPGSIDVVQNKGLLYSFLF